MKSKMYILIIAIILAVVVFGISTYMQKKLINYEATVSCLVLNNDINENKQVSKEMFKTVNIPISIVATQQIVKNFEEIEGLYAKDNIKSGQIAIKSQFDSRENLSIYEAEEGKEKLSIKIKNAENGMSYQIKNNSNINVYATMKSEYANNFLPENERMTVGEEFEGYTIIKILDNVKVIGAFTIDGVDVQKSDSQNIDSVLLAVSPEEAKQINLIRDLATFNITGVNPHTMSLEKTKSGEGV